MEHYIKDNYYYIVDGDKELLKIELINDVDGNQIVLSTENEIFAGPVSLISFDANVNNQVKS